MLECILWPEGPICPKCGTVNHAHATKKPGVFRCAEKECRKDYTVTVNTAMERSKIALHKWLQAFHLMCASKKGPSAHQLQRMLDIGYEAAWFMRASHPRGNASSTRPKNTCEAMSIPIQRKVISLSNAGIKGAYPYWREKHLHRYLADLTSATITALSLDITMANVLRWP